MSAITEKLERAIDEAYEVLKKDGVLESDELPEKFAPWNLRRAVYDAAVKMKWTKRVDRPFVDNAPTAYIHTALKITEGLKKNPQQILYLWKKSKKYRNEK